eukprot:TRINITY_DN6960_c0_g4_i3.p3 TRINITY_DN6960_c0_g4~~TRINITY_DN6960_c0_g4_i3.p3  ORF type:complete len:120 (+),score=31.08 TRINITY_DN6960_c0_g4_i3:110-469(+)
MCFLFYFFFFFFFQAEDGIRDAQESRGLGDVYKRQVHTMNCVVFTGKKAHTILDVLTATANEPGSCMPVLVTAKVMVLGAAAWKAVPFREMLTTRRPSRTSVSSMVWECICVVVLPDVR